MKHYQIYYGNFLRERVTVVTKADNQEEAIKNAQRCDKVVNNPNVMPISPEEFDKFKTKWRAVA